MYGLGVLKSLATTFRRGIQRPLTVQYPRERREIPARFRGYSLVLLIDPDNRRIRCVACGVCARACPIGIIEVRRTVGPDLRTQPLIYNGDFSRCMYCGLCVEACPFDALAMSDDFELAVYDRKELFWNKEQQLGELTDAGYGPLLLMEEKVARLQ